MSADKQNDTSLESSGSSGSSGSLESSGSSGSPEADKIVRNHVLGSIATGVVPVPLIDLIVLTGVQLRMVRALAKHYEVEFAEQRVKSLIGTLVSLGATATIGSLLKAAIPGARALFGLGGLALPAATTYAVGRVFIKHFESGGTVWTFDPSRAKEDFDAEVEAGKQVVEQSFAGVRP